MRALVLEPLPADFEALLERRRRLGLDRRDELWEGVLHMNPAPHRRHANLQAQLLEILGPLARPRGLTPVGEFNLGEVDNYRIPDAGLHRPGPDELYNPTAALAVEILSSGDESWEKLPFYAAHHVDELLIIDPEERVVRWLARDGGEYRPAGRSRLIDVTAEELTQRITWPA